MMLQAEVSSEHLIMHRRSSMHSSLLLYKQNEKAKVSLVGAGGRAAPSYYVRQNNKVIKLSTAKWEER